MSIQACKVTYTIDSAGIVQVTPTMVDNLTPTGEVDSADGAIALKNGNVVITKGSAAALTLAAPTVTTDDYKVLKITDQSGYAHTITTPSNVLNGSSTTVTFSGVVGAFVHLIAYQAVWYVMDVYNTFIT